VNELDRVVSELIRETNVTDENVRVELHSGKGCD
jgi:hypothetical protein